MNCFNHPEIPAIGYCKHCNKGLCKQCAQESNSGLSCAGKCQGEVKTTNELIQYNKERFKYILKVHPIFRYIIIILIGIGFGVWFSFMDHTNNAKTESTDNIDNNVESGLVRPIEIDSNYLKLRTIYFNYEFNELTSSWLIKQLLIMGAKDERDIDLYLCSSGGNIAEAKSVGNIMKVLKAKVNIYASGYCASSAVRLLILSTGKKVAFENTVFMFHGCDLPMCKVQHSYDAVAKEIDNKEWCNLSNIPNKIISDTSELYLSSKEALQYGLIDSIIPIKSKI